MMKISNIVLQMSNGDGGITDIVTGSGLRYQSSNPEQDFYITHCTTTFGKDMDPTIFLPAMSK